MRPARPKPAVARIVGYLALGVVTATALVACVAILAEAPRQQDIRRSDELIEEARKLAKHGQPEAALAAAQEALDIAPDNPRARRELAMHLLAWHRVGEAVVQLKQVAKERPDDAGAAKELGQALALAGDKVEAVKWLTKSVEFDRRNGITWAMLAPLQADTGDRAGARRSATRAAELAPQVPAVWYAVGQVCVRLEDRAGAMQAYRQALRIAPRFVDAIIGLAVVARAEGRNEEALQHLRRATEVAPTYAPAWTGLGLILLDLGRPQEAAQAFTRALQLDPKDAVAQQGLAKASQ